MLCVRMCMGCVLYVMYNTDDDPYLKHILKIVPYVPLSQHQNRFVFNEINEPLSLNMHAYGPFQQL